MQNSLSIRFAEEKDTPTILSLIQELADFEKLLHEVTTSEDELRTALFAQKSAEVLIGEWQGKPVAFALFFHNFSTFLGRRGLYLEDLFVKPEYRDKGFGKKLLSFLAQIAHERGCGRFEWSVLDWNKKAIDFYLKLGAKPLSDWTTYRVDGRGIAALAESV